MYEEKAEIRHFLDLQRYLDAYGVRTEGVRFRNLNELKKHRFSVVQIQNPNSTHFVIYRRTRGKSVFLLDPQSGERVLNEGDFAAIFTGYALIEVGTVKKRRKPPVRRIAFGYDVLYFLSLLVDFVLLYAINLHLSETILISGLIAAVFVNFLGKFLLNFGMFRTLDRKYVLPFIDAGATYEEVGELSRWKSEEIRFRSREDRLRFLDDFFGGLSDLRESGTPLFDCFSRSDAWAETRFSEPFFEADRRKRGAGGEGGERSTRQGLSENRPFFRKICPELNSFFRRFAVFRESDAGASP